MSLDHVKTMVTRKGTLTDNCQRQSHSKDQQNPQEDETDPDSGPEASVGPPLDVIFKILSNGRRRKICRYLVSESERTSVGELAEHIAATENNTTEEQLSSSERKRVYVALHQVHLPKMADADVIDYDKDRKTVQAKAPITVMHDCLEAVEERTEPMDNSPSGLTTTLSSLLGSVIPSPHL